MTRPLRWVGSSLEDLSGFPAEVKTSIGYALRLAQNGEKHAAARPLRGFDGAGVLEAVANFAGDTFRAVYTVRLQDAVYVLHAFQKKSTRGVKTSLHDMTLIRARLKDAETLSRRAQQEGRKP